MLRAGADQAVEGPLSPGEELYTALEHAGHVRPQEPPRQAQRDDQKRDGEREAHLEPLGLEQGDAHVNEDEDRHSQEDPL